MIERTLDAPRSATVHERCPVCLSAVTRRSWRIGGFRFDRCQACAGIFLREPPAAHESEQLDEARSGEARGYRDYAGDRTFIEAGSDELLDQIERLRARGDLLDVGAGPGFLVGRSSARGWAAVGLDVNPWAVSFAQEIVGADVRLGTVEQASFPDESFDAVTLLDVIEHIAEPDELIAECARITRSAGILAVLTPDAGSPVSRLLGSRWPELQRAPEHVVLYSVRGLATLLARHGFETIGWHSIRGKSTLRALVADVAPVAPAALNALGRALTRVGASERTFTLDPRTKFCLYARREGPAFSLAPTRQPRLPHRPRQSDAVEENMREDLEQLAKAEHFCDWMFDQFRSLVRGRVTEIGPGIGTFSARLLEAGAEELLLVEPGAACHADLQRRFRSDARVRLVAEELPGSPTLAAEAGSFDLVLCQNVLEHIEDDQAALAEVAAALRPGGSLGLLVPAHPRLYGAADERYGHYRRYTPERLRALTDAAGLEVERLYSFNALGLPGWLGANRGGSTAINARTLAIYEVLLRAWRPLEERLRPPVGLSLILHGRRPL